MRARVLLVIITGWFMGFSMYQTWLDGLTPFWTIPACAGATSVLVLLVVS